MALFLPVILAFSSFVTLANHPYQSRIAEWIGPTVSAAEPNYLLAGIAMLQAAPSLNSGDVVASKKAVEEGIMETALFISSEPFGGISAKKQSAGLSNVEDPDLGDYFSVPIKGFD